MAAKKIMIQGTMSSSGKSFLVAALCRIFKQDGYRTAPFKSQNMALNSYITEDGLEIGRAQAMQAEAAGIQPAVEMNPILLKPTSHMGSQVIVWGEVEGNWKAMDYYRKKSRFIPVIRQAFSRLEEQYEVIVLEGAGSPAEINMLEQDIVNMGMAKLVDAPVLLVGDIDRGGVFASLYGTVMLLEPEERKRIKGLVINKFRGDKKLLEPGLRMIEERLGIPVVGVIPMEAIDLDDEDSLAERLNQLEEPVRQWNQSCGKEQERDHQGMEYQPDQSERLDIAVIRLPHISNFTDFNVLERKANVSLRYVIQNSRLGEPDLVILPGTKNTMADLAWLRESGLEGEICRLVSKKKVRVIGICGGYQMLGQWLSDPDGVEGEPGSCMRGMGLLPAKTIFTAQKTRTQTTGVVSGTSQMFVGYSGEKIAGYEIHMGETGLMDCCEKETGKVFTITFSDGRLDGMEGKEGRVFGSYLHGLFDNERLTEALLKNLAEERGEDFSGIRPCGNDKKEETIAEYKEKQYDKLADLVRDSLDMKKIYQILQ